MILASTACSSSTLGARACWSGGGAKTLDECHRAAVRFAAFGSCLLEQKARNDAVDNLQYRREQLRMGGEQDAQRGQSRFLPLSFGVGSRTEMRRALALDEKRGRFDATAWGAWISTR
jgi:hypothetical protein